MYFNIKIVFVCLVLLLILYLSQISAHEQHFFGKDVFNNHVSIMMLRDVESEMIINSNKKAVSFYWFIKEKLQNMKIEYINMLPFSEISKKRELELASGEEKNNFLAIYNDIIDINQGEKIIKKQNKIIIVVTIILLILKLIIIILLIRSILKRKNIEKDLRESEEKLAITLQSIVEGVIVTDIEGKITYMNPQAEKLTGWNIVEAKGRSINKVFKIINAETKEVTTNPVSQVLKTRQIVGLDNDSILVTNNGIKRNIENSALPILNQQSELKGAVLVFSDITEQYQAKEKLRKSEERCTYTSFHDNLTGLYNRIYLENEMKNIDKEKNLPISIIIGDTNGLKLINDSYGYNIGDKLLKKTASILQKYSRADDIIARWGGDEFVVILFKTKKEDVEQICQRIKKACKISSKEQIPVSIALGYGTKTKKEEDIYQVLKKSEDLMYKNKLAESKSAKNAVLTALLKTLEAKSHETEEHALRLQNNAFKLGSAISLAPSELDRLALLVSLHDIGKITIPEKILSKKGDLTEEDWKIIKKHPEVGYRITKNTEEFAHIAKDILAHHERWDGTGYPQGLKGEEIPILARITSIVDAYDVMVNTREYKEAMNAKEALHELKRAAGSQFDPKLVNIFIKILQDELDNPC